MSKRLFLSAAVLALPATVTVAYAASRQAATPRDVYFVPMTEVTVPIIESDRIRGQMHVRLVLDTTDSQAATRVRNRLPELRSTLIGAAVEFSRLYASGRTAVNATQLTADLTKALRAKDSDISRVLIVEVAAATT
jgi:flagellar basal body-associated protein FliL